MQLPINSLYYRERGGDFITSHGWIIGEGSPIRHDFAKEVAGLDYIRKVHLSKDENVIIIEFDNFSEVRFGRLFEHLRGRIHDIRIIFGGPTFPEHRSQE